MTNTPPRLAAVPRAADTPDAGKLANLLWLRINQAHAVVQCIQLHQPLNHSDETALTEALAGAAMDQLNLALSDVGHLESCIR